jgi:hypothetical protein
MSDLKAAQDLTSGSDALWGRSGRLGMTYQREEILKSLQKDQAALRRMGVRRIGLFGSVVRGEARKDSDLDFVVELERVSFDGYMDLKFHLEDRFRKKIDLVLSHMIKPALRRRIHGETIYVPGF